MPKLQKFILRERQMSGQNSVLSVQPLLLHVSLNKPVGLLQWSDLSTDICTMLCGNPSGTLVRSWPLNLFPEWKQVQLEVYESTCRHTTCALIPVFGSLKSSSASRSRPDPILALRRRPGLTHLSFKFLPQLGEAGSFARFLLPAKHHHRVNTRGTVLWSLHAIASLHFLLHLTQSLRQQEEQDKKSRDWFYVQTEYSKWNYTMESLFITAELINHWTSLLPRKKKK